MAVLFGADIEGTLLAQLNSSEANSLGRKLRDKYGEEVAFGGVFVFPDNPLFTRTEIREGVQRIVIDDMDDVVIVRFGEGDFDGDEGWIQNALRKMRFSERTGLPSAAAKHNQHRLRPGDFPYAGAGWYAGIFGAVSGLTEEADDWVREFLSKAIVGQLEMAYAAAKLSSRGLPGQKYLLNLD